ncbi:MAG: TldD/PmbA family protein [Chloroflexi bacterium]|nr:TldD/PmbA family protein [Chloroflexota bacterium]
MEDILNLAKKQAQIAEVYYAKSSTTPVSFEAGALKSVEGKETELWALRLVKDGREGFAVTVGAAGKKELVNMALECAKFGQEVGYKLPSTAELPQVQTYDLLVEKVSTEQMMQNCQSLCDFVKELNGDIVPEAQIEKSSSSIHLINSEGFEGSYQSSDYGAYIGGTLVRGTDMLFLGSGESIVTAELDFDYMQKEVKRQYDWAIQSNKEVKSGFMPVIFTAEGFTASFMPSLLSSLNGKTVFMGASPLAKKLGEKIFDSCFSLTDAQTLNLRPASRPFDDEGTPSRNLALCQNGVLNNFIYDIKTAWQAGVNSTSSAARGGGNVSGASFTNLMIPNGKTPLKDMIAGIKEGLVVEKLLGAGQGNTLSGDFSGNVLLGYKIEDGQVTGRVKDVMISGNVFELLKEIGDMGSDGRFTDSFYTPSFMFPKVYVASQ